MNLLNNEPSFQGLRWLPMRLLALTTAITFTLIIAFAVLFGIGMVWSYAA